jgi:putative endonuclease
MKRYFYITTNKYNRVLYSGVTSNLKDRIKKHKTRKYAESFTARYNSDKLVYFERYNTIVEAIKREKQIKGGSRKKKIELINNLNPEWKDLSDILNGV